MYTISVCGELGLEVGEESTKGLVKDLLDSFTRNKACTADLAKN